MSNGDDPLGRLFGQSGTNGGSDSLEQVLGSLPATPLPPTAVPDPAVEHQNGRSVQRSEPNPTVTPLAGPERPSERSAGPERPSERSAGPEHHNGQVAPIRPVTAVSGSRRLTRGVVRRIDPWSVLKLSVVFYVTVYSILLVAAVLLWTAATTTGLRDNVESFIADLIASGQFHFVAGELLRAGAIGGAILVVLGTGANVMLAVLYNLMSDVVGGLSLVVEERGAAKPTKEPAPVAEAEPSRLLIPEAEFRQPPGPERPPERGAGPERPPERGAGPERPPERGAGPWPSRRTEPSGL